MKEIKVSKEEAEALSILLENEAAARQSLEMFSRKVFACGRKFWDKASEMYPEIQKKGPGWYYDGESQMFRKED